MSIARALVFVALLPAAAHARSFAYVPGGGLSGQISVIDTDTDTVITTITAGTVGGGVLSGAAVDPDGSRVYVPDTGLYPVPGRLLVIDAFTNTVTTTVPLGIGPRAVAVNPSGTRVYVAQHGALIPGLAGVAVIDSVSNSVVTTVPIPVFAGSVACTPDDAAVYVTSFDGNKVYRIDAATNTITATIPVAGAPTEVAITPDGSRAYVPLAGGATHMAVIDTATNTVVTTVNIGGAPSGVAIDPTGTFAYVTTDNFDTPHVTVIDTATNSLVTTIPTGESGDVRGGIALTPGGAKAYAVNAAGESDAAFVIATATNTVTSTIDVVGFPNAHGRFIGPDFLCGDGGIDPGEGCDDGLANGTNNCCSAACTLIDGDGDGNCDANETCLPATGAKLVIAKAGTPAADDKLSLKGEAVLVHPFSPSLDPVTKGVHLRIEDADSTVLDVTIPGGVYDQNTKVGWKPNGAGNKWVYKNGSAAPPSGIVKVQLQDLSKKVPGTVRFQAKGKNGSYPVGAAALPATVVLSLDPTAPGTGQCIDVAFPGPPPVPACTLTSGGTLKCK